MNEERTTLWLQLVEHLWHRQLSTRSWWRPQNFRSDDFNLMKTTILYTLRDEGKITWIKVFVITSMFLRLSWRLLCSTHITWSLLNNMDANLYFYLHVVEVAMTTTMQHTSRDHCKITWILFFPSYSWGCHDYYATHITWSLHDYMDWTLCILPPHSWGWHQLHSLIIMLILHNYFVQLLYRLHCYPTSYQCYITN